MALWSKWLARVHDPLSNSYASHFNVTTVYTRSLNVQHTGHVAVLLPCWPCVNSSERVLSDLNTKLEQLVQERDSLADDLGDFVRSSRDVLQGLNRPQLRKLMDWGFSVDDTPRAPRKAKTETVK